MLEKRDRSKIDCRFGGFRFTTPIVVHALALERLLNLADSLRWLGLFDRMVFGT